MLKVKNRKAIGLLSNRSLRASRTRNIIAVAAIALTALLFTSLFTIAMSINDGFQQSNFRQMGGYSHGGFKYLSEEQFNDLKDDPLIEQYGLRRFLGMPAEEPFNKSHVEIGYSDENQAKWMYCVPVEGRLPKEGTDEAATDRRVLELLGLEPELGEKFTITFDVDGKPTTQTFTLCGWWEYDEAIVANHVLIPESRVEEILDETGTVIPGKNKITGSWNMDVMLKNSFDIDEKLNTILASHGYQSEAAGEDNYIATGVNWGYTSEQLIEQMDFGTVIAIAAVLILIIFTGYLIIYNVFQISVAGDIRFYGLLKTIGTTSRQLKRIVKRQALLLSLIGIPIGLILGWLIGGRLTPIIVGQLDGIEDIVSLNPVIFVISALFALVTVIISCMRPGRMAAKVSPIEAFRYTGVSGGKRKERRSARRVTVYSMAFANLGRNRGKTAVTVISLSLSVVLLMLTVSLANGFDMDKYVSNMISTDFQIADASYFQTSSTKNMSLTPEIIEEVKRNGGENGGVCYANTGYTNEFITDEYYRQLEGRYKPQEVIDEELKTADRDENGLVAAHVKLYGMDDFILDHLTVFEGDLSKVRESGGKYVAAVYSTDDYGRMEKDSNWAKLGDKVKIRYADGIKYVNPETGEEYPDSVDITTVPFVIKAENYREEIYTVAALVGVPRSLSYRYYGSDEFVMNSRTFTEDTKTDSVMYYAFDVDDADRDAVEAFLSDYTNNVNPACDYESKETYAEEFNGFRNMFFIMGSALSFIVALIGVLNYFNAVLTGITVRRREFAVLQSIGMTGKQLKTMLICEGLLYTVGSVAVCLVLSLAVGPLIGSMAENMFWFFTYNFDASPLLYVTPAFALLGIVIPLISYRFEAKSTIVERLRTE